MTFPLLLALAFAQPVPLELRPEREEWFFQHTLADRPSGVTRVVVECGAGEVRLTEETRLTLVAPGPRMGTLTRAVTVLDPKTLEPLRLEGEALVAGEPVPLRWNRADAPPAALFDPNLPGSLAALIRYRNFPPRYDAAAAAGSIPLFLIGPREPVSVPLRNRGRSEVPSASGRLPAEIYEALVGDRELLVWNSLGRNRLLRVEEPAVGWAFTWSGEPLVLPPPLGLEAREVLAERGRIAIEGMPDLDPGEGPLVKGLVLEAALESEGSPFDPSLLERSGIGFEGRLEGTRLEGRLRIGAASDRPARATLPPAERPAPAPGSDAPEARDAALAITGKHGAEAAQSAARTVAFRVALSKAAGGDPVEALRRGHGGAGARAAATLAVLAAAGRRGTLVGGLVVAAGGALVHHWVVEESSGAAADPTFGEPGVLRVPLWRGAGALRPGGRLRAAGAELDPRAGGRRRIRWHAGERRTWVFEKDGKPYGYLTSVPRFDTFFGRPGVRFDAEFTLDYAGLGRGPRLDGLATSIFTRAGEPLFFRMEGTVGEKREALAFQFKPEGILAIPSRDPKEPQDLLPIRPGLFLAGNSMADHWELIAAALDLEAKEPQAIEAFVPQQRAARKWSARVEGTGTAERPGGGTAPVRLVTIPELRVRLHVTDAGELLRYEVLGDAAPVSVVRRASDDVSKTFKK